MRYESLDAKRSVIGKIEVFEGGKLVRTYLPPESDTESSEESPRVHEVRTMDCIDCHNRPTHRFDPSPSRAIDIAFRDHRLDAGTPFLKAVALPLLEARGPRPRGAGGGLRGGAEGGVRQAAPRREHLAGGHREGGRRTGRDLPAQHLAEHEDRVGYLSEPHQPRRGSTGDGRLLPLPQRAAQDGRGQGAEPGLRGLPRDARPEEAPADLEETLRALLFPSQDD